MKKSIYISVLLFYFGLNAQEHTHKSSRALSFPDIPGFRTLKADLHIHSVFSDGSVWPDIRVQEALRDNLDVISLTEHLEYQPHSKDIPHPNRNRAYELALLEAENHDLLIVNGSEITRDAPTGHNNAVFISDANKLLVEKAENAFSEAKKQGAFVFWNHPAWYPQNPNGNPVLSDFQEERIKNGELHGIEVINEGSYAEESLALALENNLTIMSTSDIHGLIDWDYIDKGHTRPITLVFAKEKSKESIKKALFAGRTVAVYNSLLVGKKEYLVPLLKESIKIKSASYISNTPILRVVLKNITSNHLLFENNMSFNFYSSSPVFEIKAGESKVLQVKTLERLDSLDLQLKAIGCYIAPRENPIVQWKVSVNQ